MRTALWVDDIRTPPNETWDWAKTVEEALALMHTHQYEIVSLDHDLAEEHYTGDFSLAPCGYDLVKQMIEDKILPDIVCLHTANPIGRANMAATLDDHYALAGFCSIGPYHGIEMFNKISTL